MHAKSRIQSVGQIYGTKPNPLPDLPGVYAFWWISDRDRLLQKSNRNVLLAGPGGKKVKVVYEDWWPPELVYPCLYVGKTNNVKTRFGQHIMHGMPARLHAVHADHHKQKPYNTACQLRHGIEHIFPDESSPLEVIYGDVGFSYRADFKEHNAVAERFFEEDRLVGIWRPWFNIDSER
jgi:hypothetical protein